MALAAHECMQGHKLCRDVLFRPEIHLALAPRLQPEPEAAASSAVPEAAASAAAAVSAKTCSGKELAATNDLFKGRVPQVQEWLDVWADTSSGVSFLKQASISRKKGHACKSRFQRTKMAGVMAEITRRKNRALLKEASSITIALDESNTRKVVRFCCDTPRPPYTAHGLIGTLRLSYEQKGEDAGGDPRTDGRGPRCARVAGFETLPCLVLHKADQDDNCRSQSESTHHSRSPWRRYLLFRRYGGIPAPGALRHLPTGPLNMKNLLAGLLETPPCPEAQDLGWPHPSAAQFDIHNL